MVGYDVEDLAETDLTESLAETLMCWGTPELFVHAAMIDDVVAMHAAGSGLQIRRAVNVRDAELMEIRRDCGCVVKGEIFM
jgi:hypothetical protein